MSTIINQIESAQDALTSNTGKWVTNSIPTEPECGWETFTMSKEQFRLAQRIVSGSELGESIASSIKFLLDRETRLSEEGEGQPYCFSGWFTQEGVLYLWYKTTSGTVLCHAASETEELLQILLPKARLCGYHHKEISRVKAGMTSDQYDRWYNSHCIKGKEREYAEMAEFHNTHLVPQGWEPMLTGRQFVVDRQIQDVLRPIHGDWSADYGLGQELKILLGDPGERHSKLLTGGDRLAHARSILRQLEKATSEWRSLMEEWAKEEGTMPVEEEEYEDYEGNEEEYEE